MDNPVLVEVLRGAVAESCHRGAVAVVDTDGTAAFLCGDVDRPVFPRSSIKALQALRLIETGAAIPDDRRGIAGCSVPTWAVPLKLLALGFARFGTGNRLAPERAKAAARLRAACAAHPWYVAGTGRFCTEVMQRLGARAFVKV